MPFPGDLSSLYTRNRFMSEIEQPTQTGGMTAPQFGGSPEQLMQILQHPQVQQGLQQFLGQGYHFDPQQIRQSPFLPQQFMQHHPQMGGAMTGAMANVAATPDAPMVSGAGNGMSRAMQGMMGGPEMLRQYQIRQMLAPMQAAGMQIPMQEFGRKEQLLQLLQRGERHGEQMSEDEMARRQAADAEKARMDTERINATRPVFDPLGGSSYMYQQGQPQQPPQMGGVQGLAGAQQGGGMQPGAGPFPQQPIPGTQGGGAIPGLIAPQAPGMPAQQGGWQKQDTSTQRIGAVADAKETAATKDQKKSGAKEKRSKAALEDRTDPNLRGGRGGRFAGTGGVNPTQISSQYNKAEKDYKDAMAGYDAAFKAGKLDQRGYDDARTQALAALQQSKANTDQAQGNPGASARGEQQAQQKKNLLSPGAVQRNMGGQGQPPQAQGGGQQQPELHQDEAGNLWDMSSGQPVYAGKAGQPQ